MCLSVNLAPDRCSLAAALDFVWVFGFGLPFGLLCWPFALLFWPLGLPCGVLFFAGGGTISVDWSSFLLPLPFLGSSFLVSASLLSSLAVNLDKAAWSKLAIFTATPMGEIYRAEAGKYLIAQRNRRLVGAQF